MALNKDQLQRLKKSQQQAQKHSEIIGARLLHPINYELLEQDQEQPKKVELDQQTTKDIQEQVKGAIEDAFKDVFK